VLGREGKEIIRRSFGGMVETEKGTETKLMIMIHIRLAICFGWEGSDIDEFRNGVCCVCVCSTRARRLHVIIQNYFENTTKRSVLCKQR